jgi:chromate reductase
MNILALSGSIRKDSYNTHLIEACKELAPAGTTITLAPIDQLPLFNADLEESFPAEATALKKAIEAADGIIIATPEFNRSIPGVLKNAIDWVSRPWGHNSFAGKPVLTMGVSVGRLGAAVAQSHLRQILLYLDAQVIGQPEIYVGPASTVFDASGVLTDQGTKDLLTQALSVLMSRKG